MLEEYKNIQDAKNNINEAVEEELNKIGALNKKMEKKFGRKKYK